MFRSACARWWRLVWPEAVACAALTAVALHLIAPFLTDRFIGASDAVWYYCLLDDHLHQTRAGIFPVYVGQSHANWNGHPVGLLAGYLLTGAALDLVTGGRYSTVEVQHLTLAWSIWAGALSAYACLRALPARRWLAGALACLYVSCPGTLCLPGGLDMYPSFMVLPYVPVVLYGLARGARRGDGTAAGCLGGGTALVWMCHAAIALWLSVGGALFVAALAARRGRFWHTVRFAALAGAAFAVLSAWYFATVFSMELHRSHGMTEAPEPPAGLYRATGPKFADDLTRNVRASVPGAYLPLGDRFEPMSYFQLGYGLLGLLGFAAGVALRERVPALRAFVGAALGLLVLLHPLAGLTWHVWANLPRTFGVTGPWPMQRFYVLLAGLGAFAGALAVERVLSRGRAALAFTVAAPHAAPRRHVLPARAALAAVVLVVGTGYSLHQAQKVRALGFRARDPDPVPAVSRPENQSLRAHNWLTVHDPRTTPDRVTVGDPLLYNRVLDADGVAVLAANREAAGRGTPVPFVPAVALPFRADAGTSVRPLLTARFESERRYLLTLRVTSQNVSEGAALVVRGATLRREYRPLDNTGRPQTVRVTLWTSAPGADEVQVSLASAPADPAAPATLSIDGIELTRYEATDLPVRVDALHPYAATVRTDRPARLETHLEFVKGYEATVNGARVEPAPSPDGMLTVPLAEGDNEVRLVYRGTPAARAAFVVSGLGWLAALGAAVRVLGRRLAAGGREATASA
ncbi:hypothetical protein R5W23_004862 [Gemmata sp. JC673]|uniref:Membrane protein 6-pyruvoyl-tetrahydropterin synthase-related domain-containing protein n=1 Tax=Gemmata algarum TaxID=2975278 RepID=A0ABU5F7V9_9BACT|nr:hypothetical protein [Gemmata algarum]MDY3563360.1 hypothetical protein [Gemmata algarum]